MKSKYQLDYLVKTDDELGRAIVEIMGYVADNDQHWGVEETDSVDVAPSWPSHDPADCPSVRFVTEAKYCHQFRIRIEIYAHFRETYHDPIQDIMDNMLIFTPELCAGCDDSRGCQCDHKQTAVYFDVSASRHGDGSEYLIIQPRLR